VTTLQTDIHRDLIERSKRGDQRSQYQIYSLYAKAMYNISLRMMNSKEAAEDILQDAFTDAFLNLSHFRYESTFGAWLKRIVVNKCINEIRRRKADLQFFDDMHYFEGKKDEDEEPLGLNVEAIKRAMEQLPKGSKLIFSLYLLEGYDHSEIAEILNISESNSKTQYMRAKDRVREILKDQLKWN